MRVLSKIVKSLFNIGLALWVLIQSYTIGLMVGGAVTAPVLAFLSAINKLPPAVTDRWWMIYLLSGIPVGIYSLVYLVKGLLPRKSEQDKKQDNGNQ